MLAADVPLWFAAIAVAATGVTALLTQLITGWQNGAQMKHETVEHEKDREHTVRVEVLRELRAERVNLYRRLIDAAERVLGVNYRSASEVLDEVRSDLQPDAQRQTRRVVTSAVEWKSALTEAKFLGSSAVREAALAVDKRREEVLRERLKEAIIEDDPNIEAPVVDTDAKRAGLDKSRSLVDALVEACSDDMEPSSDRSRAR